MISNASILGQSPTVSRVRDSLGFHAGDANLYRYVGNNPTNETDPSGLVAVKGWDFWANEPRKQLDITASRDSRLVKKAIESLDGDFSLDSIPYVEARNPVTSNITTGRWAPEESLVGPDRSMGVPGGTGLMIQRSTPAELARINIRVNLLSLKQSIVTAVVLMLKSTQPAQKAALHPEEKIQPLDLSHKNYERIANSLADDYIRGTDSFLRDHPGARPSLGQRRWLLDATGIQNEFNAPWCADWAPYMQQKLNKGSNDPNQFNDYLKVEFMQWNSGGFQHNFQMVRPVGYAIKVLPEIDNVAVIFDPWRDLLPRVYSASKTSFAPTNIYVK